MGKYLWLGLCAGGILAAQPAAVHAQDDDDDFSAPTGGRDVNCRSELGSERIDGDLQVTGRCTLSGTDVRGNVTLFAGGSLTAREAHIRGNLEANRADFVILERSRVDGVLRLTELVGDESVIDRTDVRRDLELTANRSRLELLNNELRGDLLVFSNSGGVLISGNAIDDDLRCSSNVPAPTGTGNRVEGARTGQCQNLQAETPTPAPPPPAPTPTPTPTPTPSPTPAPTPSPTPSPSPSPTPAPSPTAELAPDEGGAGALGWPGLLLLPLLAWRLRQREGAARR
jgi:hypothetical protein